MRTEQESVKKMRKLSGLSYKFIYVYFVIIGLFHLYTSVFGAYESYLQKNIHLGLVLPTAFFLFPMYKGAPKDRVPIYDWILGAISAIPSLYVVLNYDDIVMRVIQVDPVTQAQFICGILLFVLLLEGTRRVVGIPLTLIAFLFAAYMYCGQMRSNYDNLPMLSGRNKRRDSFFPLRFFLFSLWLS